jgi:hypothetical protein
MYSATTKRAVGEGLSDWLEWFFSSVKDRLMKSRMANVVNPFETLRGFHVAEFPIERFYFFMCF